MIRQMMFTLILCATLTATQAHSQASVVAPAASTPKASMSPEQLLANAHSVTLIGALGYVAERGITLNPSAEKAQQSLEKEIRKWGRFTVVEDPAKADLVLILYAGNRAAGGGGVFVTAKLVIFPGGSSLKRGDLPLWQDDASGSILSPTAAPKVIAKFRTYLENLDKTLPAIEAPAAPAQPAQTTPVEATLTPPAEPEKKLEEHPQLPTPSVLSARPEKYISPFEIISKAKTFTIRGHGAAGHQGVYDKLFGIGQYSDVQAAMTDIDQQMSEWGRMQYVKEVPMADLVILVYQWDTRVYSKQFHGIQSCIVIAEGGEAYKRDDPPLWTSGSVNGSTKELIENLRFELDQAALTKNLQPTHNANKEYNRGSDSINSAEKSKYRQEKDESFSDAVAELRRSLRNDYGYAPAHERLGTALKGLGFNADAVYEYKLALQLQPSMIDAIKGLALAMTSVPDYDEALKAMDEWMRVVPGQAESYLAKGDIYYLKKDFGAAAGAYREAIRIDPNQQLTMHKLGRALYRWNHMEEAEKAFRDALALNANDEDSIVWLGSTLNEMHKPEEAVNVLQPAEKSHSKRGALHLELSRALRALQKYDDALNEIQLAIDIAPTSITYRTEQALTLYAAGKKDEALAKFKDISLNMTDIADAHVDLAIALLSVSQNDEALKELNRAIEQDQKNARAWFYLGRAHEAMGDKTAAESDYQKARSIDPLNTEFQKVKD